MPKLSVWMIRAALLHLGIGFSFGALLLANKGVLINAALWRLLEPHIEILIVGWMIQLAMGVAFYALPRHSNSEARYGKESLGWLSFVLLNCGIWLSIGVQAFVGNLMVFVALAAYVALMFPRVKAFGV